jgi:hypothetical protein
MSRFATLPGALKKLKFPFGPGLNENRHRAGYGFNNYRIMIYDGIVQKIVDID